MFGTAVRPDPVKKWVLRGALAFALFSLAIWAGERESFLAAIRAEPAEDTSRLAYADWLDEHGEAERAEFIRVQVELARLSKYSPRRKALRDRAVKLLEQNERHWLPPDFEKAFEGEVHILWERGFISHLSTSLAAMARPAARQALRSVELISVLHWIHEPSAPIKRRALRGIRQSRILDRVGTLDFGPLSLSDDEFAELLPAMAHLRGLCTGVNPIRPPSLAALSDSRLASNLRFLDISATLLANVGESRLIPSRFLRLEHIAIPNWSDSLLMLGGDAVWPALRRVTIGGSRHMRVPIVAEHLENLSREAFNTFLDSPLFGSLNGFRAIFTNRPFAESVRDRIASRESQLRDISLAYLGRAGGGTLMGTEVGSVEPAPLQAALYAQVRQDSDLVEISSQALRDRIRANQRLHGCGRYLELASTI